MTEDDVRRIVREELDRRDAWYPYVPHGLPDARPIQTLPMPKYEYPTPTYHPPSSSRGAA